MNVRHMQHTTNPMKDSSHHQKQERTTVYAYPTSSTKEDCTQAVTCLIGANQQVDVSNHLQLAVFSYTHIQIQAHQQSFPGFLHLFSAVICKTTFLVVMQAVNPQITKMLIAVSLTSCLLNIQPTYRYKPRHVLFIFQQLAFVFLHFSPTSSLLLSYKNHHVTIVGNACMIHLCNCSSLILNHPLSAGENVSDLSTPYGNKQTENKNNPAISLGFHRQSSNKNVCQKSTAISALP